MAAPGSSGHALPDRALDQFRSLVVLLLLAAAVVAWVLGLPVGLAMGAERLARVTGSGRY